MHDYVLKDYMMSSYLVTAIVSTYKAERYLRGCLDDLLKQTLGNRLEIIVIDSGSPESEGAIVREYLKLHDNIRYIRTEQRETIYQAWNRGVAAAKGKYITNANSDDRHRPDALELMANVLEDGDRYGVAYADCFITETENDTWEKHRCTGVFHWPLFDPKLLFKVCFIGPQPMWRKNLHDKYGLFDGGMKSAGDYDFWMRLASRGVDFVHIPETLGLYLASPTGMEASNYTVSENESNQSRRLHWPRKWGKLPPAGGTFRFAPLGDKPLVTVVIPTLNRHAMLKDALTSLLAQSYDNWEACVVNDGGEDNGEDILRMDKKGRIRYLRHFTRLGQPAARNTALRVSGGEIITYLDDDDLFAPAHLEGIVNRMSEVGTPFVFTGAEKVFESLQNGRRTELSRVEYYQTSVCTRRDILVRNRIPINAWAHRRACLEHIGFFDETMSSHEDWDFLLRLTKLWDFGKVSGDTAEVRIRADVKDSVTTRKKHDHFNDYSLIYARNPSDDPDILFDRERVLDEEAAAPRTRMAQFNEKVGLLLNRHLLWRFR
ncbi:MAG: glycosyltransferase [Pseudomonadota bacterium]|nr:glycosyltransferase [Pseudomonadota bacterium]MDP1904970.1 glycosyltransferase [Pseudomonadota bacterium]MDP2351103.1 glycosyltransferase [Pseudomonadota bacterium]